jgi:hypothetical protein
MPVSFSRHAKTGNGDHYATARKMPCVGSMQVYILTDEET